MKPKSKLILIVSGVLILDAYLGWDTRFTIINLLWCVPIAYDWIKEINNK